MYPVEPVTRIFIGMMMHANDVAEVIYITIEEEGVGGQ